MIKVKMPEQICTCTYSVFYEMTASDFGGVVVSFAENYDFGGL